AGQGAELAPGRPGRFFRSEESWALIFLYSRSRALLMCSVDGEQFARQFGKRKCSRVSFRDQGRRDIPGNGNFRIAPKNGVFVRGIIKIAAFIEKLNAFREHQESVSKPARNIDL